MCITDMPGRICPSTCGVTGGCDVNWGSSYSSLKGMLPESSNVVTGDIIKQTSNLKDYALLYNLSVAQDKKNEVNCWLNCMDTAKCIGFKWDSSSTMCTMYSSMVVGQSAKQATDTIQWMCGNSAMVGELCTFTDLITKRKSPLSGPAGTYRFQPDPGCPAYNCEGILYNDMEIAPTSAPTFAPAAADPCTVYVTNGSTINACNQEVYIKSRQYDGIGYPRMVAYGVLYPDPEQQVRALSVKPCDFNACRWRLAKRANGNVAIINSNNDTLKVVFDNATNVTTDPLCANEKDPTKCCQEFTLRYTGNDGGYTISIPDNYPNAGTQIGLEAGATADGDPTDPGGVAIVIAHKNPASPKLWVFEPVETSAAPTFAPSMPPTNAPTLAPTPTTAAPTQPVRWDESFSSECLASVMGINDGGPSDPNRNLMMEKIVGTYTVNTSKCKELCLNAGVLCTGYQINKGNTECILWKMPIAYRPSSSDYDCTIKLYPELEYGQTAQNTSVTCYISAGAGTLQGIASVGDRTQKLNICSSATYYNRPVTLTNGPTYINATYDRYDIQTQSSGQTFDSSWYFIPVDNLSGVFYIQHALSGYRMWGDVRTDLTSGLFKCTTVGYPGSLNVVEMFTMRQNSDTNGTYTFIPYLSCTGCNQYANMVLSMIKVSNQTVIGLKPESDAVMGDYSQNSCSWNINSLSYPFYGFGWANSSISTTHTYNGLPSTILDRYSGGGDGDTIQFNQMTKNGFSMSNNCVLLQTNKLYHLVCGVQAALPDYGIFGFTVKSNDNVTVGMPGSSIYLNKPLNTRSETSKNVTSFIYDTAGKTGTDLQLRMSCMMKDMTGSLAGLPNFYGPLQAGDILVPTSTSYVMVNELSPFYQNAQVSLTDDGSGYQTISAVPAMLKMTKVMYNNNLLVTSYFPYITLSNSCVYLIQCSVQGNVPGSATIRIQTKSGKSISSSNWIYLRNPQSQSVTNTGTLTCIYNTSGITGDDLLLGLYVTEGTTPIKISKYSEMTITQLDSSVVYRMFMPAANITSSQTIPFTNGLISGNGGLSIKSVSGQWYTQLVQDKLYKIICTLGTNQTVSRALFQMKTLSGTSIGTQLILSNQYSESGLETVTMVYSTWGKTGNDLLIGMVSNATMKLNGVQCQLSIIEMTSKNPNLTPAPTLPVLMPPSMVNGVDVTKELYLVSYLNYNKLTYNATAGNLNVSIPYSETTPPTNTRFKFVQVVGTSDEYNLINVSSGSRVYIDTLTGTINVFGDNSPPSEDVIDRFKFTTYTVGASQFVSIKTSMSVCTADYCINNTDEYLLVNDKNSATFINKNAVGVCTTPSTPEQWAFPCAISSWYIEPVPAPLAPLPCDLYGISLCNTNGVYLSAFDGNSWRNVYEGGFLNTIQANALFVDDKGFEPTKIYFENSDIDGWFYMYERYSKTRVYLRYDVTYNHLKIDDNNYLNQLYYFRAVPYGAMNGVFGIEARAGRDCKSLCSNKYLRRFTGSPLTGIIDGTTDKNEMLLFRII